MNSSHAFFTFNRFTRDQQLNQLRESFWILIVYPNSINQVSIILKNIKGIMLTKGGESWKRRLFGEASISKPIESLLLCLLDWLSKMRLVMHHYQRERVEGECIVLQLGKINFNIIYIYIYYSSIEFGRDMGRNQVIA